MFAILFLWLSFSSFRSMPKKGETAKEPGWITSLTKASPLVVFGLSVLILLVNTKNTPLYITMGVSVANQNLPTTQEWLTIGVLALLCSATALAVVVVAYVMGERAQDGLMRLRDWLVQNNGLVMGLLFLLLGVSQLSTAIGSL